MPSQDRFRRDEERRPALSVDEACLRGDERPVRPGEPRLCDLAAEHRHLVAQHQDLGVFGHGVHVVDRQGFYDATDQAVEEAEHHEPARSLLTSSQVKSRIVLLDPSGILGIHTLVDGAPVSHVCYSRSMSEVASRELRNDTRGLLRRVAAGEDIVITVDGEPVAALRPLRRRPRWMQRTEFVRRLSGRQADPGLDVELRALAPDMTDELER